VKRFRLWNHGGTRGIEMRECGAGVYVLHSDHAAEMKRIEDDYLKLNNIACELRARAERAEKYVAGQDVRSDFRTAAEMRAALDLARAELARVEGERDAALLRIDDLEADATKAMHDAGVLKRLEYNRIDDTGSIEAVVQSPFMRILGEWIAADFKLNGGTNYVEQELSLTITDHSEPQVYTVLVQKAGGKTPAQVAGELRKHNAILRAECDAARECWIICNHEYTISGEKVDALAAARAATDAAGILNGGES